MSTKDVVNTGNRKTTSRRVKFGATLENLEGRVLLSSVHHFPHHQAAHVRMVPMIHAKTASQTTPVSHANAATPTRMTPGSSRPRPEQQ